jgi:hypothetical protein
MPRSVAFDSGHEASKRLRQEESEGEPKGKEHGKVMNREVRAGASGTKGGNPIGRNLVSMMQRSIQGNVVDLAVTSGTLWSKRHRICERGF